MYGIGGDGEYCGDNDAQLDRINVFYHGASGGEYAPRTVLFESGMIDAVRASHACRALPSGQVRELKRGRGQQLGQGPLKKG
jgi:tubulin beta